MEASELLDALRKVTEWAEMVLDHWDNDRDSKVGKHLAAMSGNLRNYSPIPNLVHELLAKYDSKEIQ